MANRSFQMYEYRRVLVRMRRGDLDRAIQRAGLMGRDKTRFWPRPRNTSQVEPCREQMKSWLEEGLQATTIHEALRRIHRFTGSYSSVRRFLRQLDPEPRERTMLFPGRGAQVDFGSGPKLADHTAASCAGRGSS